MGLANCRLASDEEKGFNHSTQGIQSDEEEQQLKFLKKWLGWLSFSGPAAIALAGYDQSKKIQNKNAKGLLHASTVFMGVGFIFALTLWILAHTIHGFGKRLKHGVVSTTVVVAMAVVLVVVSGFF